MDLILDPQFVVDSLQQKNINVLGTKKVFHNYETLCKEIITLGPGAVSPQIASDMRHLYWGLLSFNPVELNNLIDSLNTAGWSGTPLSSVHTIFKGERQHTLYEAGLYTGGTPAFQVERTPATIKQVIVYFDTIVTGDIDHSGFTWPGSQYDLFDKALGAAMDKYKFSLFNFVGYRFQLDQ